MLLSRNFMEKEENWLKYLPVSPRQGKKLLIFFAAVNVIVILIYFYKSPNLPYFYAQTKLPVIKSVPIPIYNVSVFHIPLLHAKDMLTFYVEVTKKTWCFLYGIDLNDSKRRKKCICAENWFGLDCGIPSAVWKSDFLQEGKNANIEIRRREKPRRIICSFVVGGYQDILDINIINSFSVVDLYLTIEGSNEKPSILHRFKRGYLAEWQSKIIPFELNKTVSSVINVEDTLFMIKGLWDIGWKRLSDFRPDDLLIFSHASSIISKDVLLFLKLYDGFTEPFHFELRPLLFKFWRQIKSNSSDVKLVPFRPAGCTFQFLSSMCDFEIAKLFNNECNALDTKNFEKNNWPLKNWIVGSDYAPSGWQCNFCCKDKCVQTHQTDLNLKKSIPVADQKSNVSVGKNFSEQMNTFNYRNLSYEKINDSDPFFAPNAVLNKEKYSYLVDEVKYF